MNSDDDNKPDLSPAERRRAYLRCVELVRDGEYKARDGHMVH